MFDLNAGDILVVEKLFYDRGRKEYTPGMIFKLIKPTNDQSTYGFDPTGPYNWIVSTPYTEEGLWTSMYHCIENGYLRKLNEDEIKIRKFVGIE